MDPDAFNRDYQCLKLLAKYPDFPGVYDTREEAMRSFIEAEVMCAGTNDHFIDFPLGSLGGALTQIMLSAKRKISNVLGDCPLLYTLPFRFGPGNNVGLKRTTSVFDKLNVTPTVTPALRSEIQEILGISPSWIHNLSTRSFPSAPASCFVDVRTVVGSELGFVPKSAKTDRPICTEPLLNSFVQLGLGAVIRSRLRKTGCNLDDQSHNGELARIGSISGHLATVDLKSASDTISYMTVLELLPSDWFDLMDKARSRFYTYEGRTYSFEKFSSMGNGFTFELQSLIFLALARATCSFLGIRCTEVSVYGDDIIIPTEAYTMFSQVLEYCGFTVNQTKSFHSGPFRESCGADFFLGQNVRPVAIKKSLSNEVLMSICNQLYRKSLLRDPMDQLLYDTLEALVPKPYHRLRGPDGYGDGHFVCDWRPERSPMLRRKGWEGHTFFTVSSSPTPDRSHGSGAWVAILYLLDQRSGPSNMVHGIRLEGGRLTSVKTDESLSSRDGYFLHQRRNKSRPVVRAITFTA